MSLEDWDTAPIPIPPRSRLLGTAPFGLRTPLVESLISYLLRLAARHLVPVGRLILREIAPLTVEGLGRQWTEHSTTTALRVCGHNICGTGPVASTFADAVARLTLRPEMRRLTLLPGFSWLPQLGLVRTSLAYCPAFFAAMGDSRHIPLIWSLRPLKMCPIHELRLAESCPNPKCGLLPAISYHSRIGLCPRCGMDLGVAAGTILDLDERAWQRFVYSQLAPLVTRDLPTTDELARRAIVSAIAIAAPTNASLSRELLTSKPSIRGWLAGSALPSIEMLLRLAYLADVELSELADGICRPRGGPRTRHPAWSPIQTKKRMPWPEVEAILRAELAGTTVRSFHAILPDLGRFKSSVVDHFPELVDELKSRYAHESRRAIEANRAEQARAVRAAVAELREGGAAPTKRAVEAITGLLLRRGLLTAWRQEVRLAPTG